jgi:hypothetical protein
MRKTIRIYDNGGATADRYTAIDMDRPTGDPGLFEAVGFDDNPFHPQGFGQHTSAMPGAHLGKRISVIELPEPAQKFVEQFEQEGKP